MDYASSQRIRAVRCCDRVSRVGLRPCVGSTGFSIFLVLFSTLGWSGEVQNAVAEQQDNEHRYGLIATLQDKAGNQCRRVDERIAFDWGTDAPDPRIGDTFRVQWAGYLLAQQPGKHRLHLRVSGKAQLRLRNQVVLDAGGGGPERWYSTSPLELPFGWHALELEFEKSNREAKVQLFWTGPGFGLEPVSPRFLFHDVRQAVPDRFERGRQLVSALRCAACHQIPGVRPVLPAPELTRVKGNIHHAWLVDWVVATSRAPQDTEHASEIPRRMPKFTMDRDAGEELVAYLSSVSPLPLEKVQVKGERAIGQKLFLSLGCLACHRWQTLGQEGLFGGGDLSQIARKRPAHFFSRWLADPASLNRHHRMPTFELTTEERGHLAVFLTSLKTTPVTSQVPQVSDEQVVRGKQRFERQRCGACHVVGGEPAKKRPVVSTLSAKSAWQRSCVAAPSEDGIRPGYQLTAIDRQAVQLYI